MKFRNFHMVSEQVSCYFVLQIKLPEFRSSYQLIYAGILFSVFLIAEKMYQDYTVLHYQTLQLILRSVQPNLRSVQPIFKAVQPFFMPVQQFCSLVQLNFSQVKMFLMLVPFPQSGSIVFRQIDTNLMLIYSFFSGHFTSI